MKKIFILPILIAPIMAHATNPVGPSAVGQGETPVIATASAPYATAGAETGDTTNVVSASYVKGAYNDAIAAVNKVADKVSTVEGDLSSLSEFVNVNIEYEIANKQDKLEAYGSDDPVFIGNDDEITTRTDDYLRGYEDSALQGSYNLLATVPAVVMAVKTGTDYIQGVIDLQRVNAVTTWGNDSATQLTLSNAD